MKNCWTAIAVAVAGFYVSASRRVVYVGPDGMMNTVVGGGAAAFHEGGGDTAVGYSGRSPIALNGAGELITGLAGRVVLAGLAGLPGVGDDAFLIPSRGRGQLFQFDRSGRHLSTLDALTGITLYGFEYDGAGRLAAIADRDGQYTRIERAATGQPLAILAPGGQRSLLETDANGWLSAVEDPVGGRHRMEYTKTGLLTAYTSARGLTDRFVYDESGRLIRNETPNGGGWRLTRKEKRGDLYSVTLESAEGRISRYEVESLRGNAFSMRNTHADGSVSTVESTPSERNVLARDGSRHSVRYRPDPVFGMTARITAQQEILLPGGNHFRASIQREVTSEETSFFPEVFEERHSFNGDVFTYRYEAASRTWRMVSPEGRSGLREMNALGRPVRMHEPGLAPLEHEYENAGRLTRLSRRSGDEIREMVLAYHQSGPATGWLSEMTNALGHGISFEYDNAGRITRQTLADGRMLQYAYDAEGNLLSLVPPGRDAHVFTYDLGNQLQDYTAPGPDFCK